MAGYRPRLTEEQKAEIVRRYDAGEGMTSIQNALNAGGNVWRVLKAAGRGRSRSEALLARWDTVPGKISADRWRELYLGPKSGLPSVLALARRFSVRPNTIRLHLRKHGIPLRTASEQARASLASGARGKPGGGLGRLENLRPGSKSGRKLSNEELSKLQEGLREYRRKYHPIVDVPCWWCGEPCPTSPSHRAASPRRFCDNVHMGKGFAWTRWRGDAPRPLILDRLRDLLREEPYRALPFTWVTAEKAAATIGAGEAEIAAVLTESR